ncbi:dimethylamine monooxygenase subunit DmmA family protein [Gluconacetobacter tumulisoli]|uniref:Dimethylamine monooxygenase subunit DmmA-like C-terminal domain-containing protein n=1 Tax=Gluconacetobacter tumulisoli TaxID=1286189 RepID=A0A7W4K8I8_9PROT|nr:dimethylamine monooxygenase subunit DmmA family protein [Gluconacetobacter tumulisoli]MBB2202339.1 hypothetical protein [Gluconacetobacter tumulisoli]
MTHEAGHPSAGTGREHRRFVPSATTNLPRWPASAPGIDPQGRGFVLVGLGPAGADTLAGWAADVAAAGHPCRQRRDASAQVTADTLAWLDDALGAARVGWRLMLAGPASDILELAARARTAGMIEAEIRCHAVGEGPARLQCVHCKTLFRAEAVPGSHVACPGCGRALVVHQHLSRRLAALVAFSADAEASA